MYISGLAMVDEGNQASNVIMEYSEHAVSATGIAVNW